MTQHPNCSTLVASSQSLVPRPRCCCLFTSRNVNPYHCSLGVWQVEDLRHIRERGVDRYQRVGNCESAHVTASSVREGNRGKVSVVDAPSS